MRALGSVGAAEVLKELPKHVDVLHDHIDKTLDIRPMLESGLKSLSPHEFEGVLHPVFEEEEFILWWLNLRREDELQNSLSRCLTAGRHSLWEEKQPRKDLSTVTRPVSRLLCLCPNAHRFAGPLPSTPTSGFANPSPVLRALRSSRIRTLLSGIVTGTTGVSL